MSRSTIMTDAKVSDLVGAIMEIYCLGRVEVERIVREHLAPEEIPVVIERTGIGEFRIRTLATFAADRGQTEDEARRTIKQLHAAAERKSMLPGTWLGIVNGDADEPAYSLVIPDAIMFAALSEERRT